MRYITGFLLTTVCAISFAQDSAVAQKILDAMASDARTEAEVARDRNRKPVETLAFFGLQDDMKVLELLPGGGWYTKLLAPTLRENGELHVAIGTNTVRDNLVTQDGFDHVNVIEVGSDAVSAGPFSFGESDFDLAVTFRNMHSFDAAGRANINAAVFDALDSGGHYGVIDHTLRHMQPRTRENRRRTDPVLIIKELLDAGFEMVDYSDLHYRPDDELRYEVGRATVTGNTDRYTFLFRKP